MEQLATKHVEREEIFRLLVESVTDYAIFMLDPNGYVVSWNRGAQRLKGYSADEITGKHFSIFYPREDIERDKPARELEVARAEGRLEDEGWRIRKDGSRFWANVVISAVHDERGALRGFAKVTRDLTELRRAEDDRLRLARSEEAVRLRDDFISIAAHELRTPLNALNLYLQTGRIAIEKGAPLEDIGAAIEKSLKQVRRLVELVDRLLDASRITTGALKLVLQPSDVRALLLDAVDALRADARQRGSTISVDAPESVAGVVDRLRVEQLFTNVLHNAIKYGRGQDIRVELRRVNDAAVVHIADGGIGIAERDVARIYERFERTETAGRFRGLGLGLYICKSIVDAHGGSIDVETTVGVGSTFTIRLPLQISS